MNKCILPLGIVVKEKDIKVYKLKKVLYCLKQALMTWYNKPEMHLYIKDLKCSYEHIMFMKNSEYEMSGLGKCVIY